MFRFPKAKDFLFITNAAMIFEEGEDDGNISKWVCKFLEGLSRCWHASNRTNSILNMFV